MAELPLLREASTVPRLGRDPAKHKCGGRPFRASDLLLSSRQGVSGLLPAVRPLRVRVVRFAVGRGACLPRVLRARARRVYYTEAGKAEWRHRDVLYDSIAVTIGWGWILFWPVIVAAIPIAILLHVKYRKAPRSYLIPRSGWRFWAAYAGLIWLPLFVAIPFLVRWMAGRS